MKHTFLITVAIVSVTLGQFLPLPILLEPTSGQTGVPVIATLRWANVVGANEYNIQTSLAENFPVLHTNQNTSDTFIVVDLSLPNTIFYWRVMAIGDGIASPGYSTDMFTTDILPPTKPFSGSPLGPILMGINPVLKWDSSPTATAYKIQLATDMGFTDLLIDLTILDTTYPTSELQNLTDYYWRVRACNSGGCSDWTGRWPFKLSTPSRPMTAYPADGATNIAMTDTLRWTKSKGSIQYFVKLSATGDFVSPDLYQGVTDTFLTLDAILMGDPQYSTTYQWVVTGSHSTGTSDPSDTASFTTEEQTTTTVSRFKTPLQQRIRKEWFDLKGRKILKTRTGRIYTSRGCYILMTEGKVIMKLHVLK